MTEAQECEQLILEVNEKIRRINVLLVPLQRKLAAIEIPQNTNPEEATALLFKMCWESRN